MYIALGILVFSYIYLSSAQPSCQLYDDECSCQWTDTKKVITLRGIDNPRESAFSNYPQQHQKKFFFNYNPCTPFQMGDLQDPTAKKCIDAYVCQHTNDKTPAEYYVTGRKGTFSTGMHGIYPVFKYSGDGNRKTEILLICDWKAETPKMSDPLESPEDTYRFNITSKCACLDGCVGKSPSGPLSTGSILLILFFVFLLVYFVGGFLFLKYFKKKEGTEVIPNYEFWKDFPAKVKDGCIYTKDFVKGWKGRSEYQEI